MCNYQITMLASDDTYVKMNKYLNLNNVIFLISEIYEIDSVNVKWVWTFRYCNSTIFKFIFDHLTFRLHNVIFVVTPLLYM